MPRRRKRVSFRATKKVSKPVRVRFVDKYGKLVSFKATKKVSKPVKVTFYAKRKRRSG
jgi:hypothetical protein